MGEKIDEPVRVLMSFGYTPRGAAKARPEILVWNERRYRVEQLTLYHPTTKGARMVHIFDFLAEGGILFKAAFDAEALTWRLLEVDYGS